MKMFIPSKGYSPKYFAVRYLFYENMKYALFNPCTLLHVWKALKWYSIFCRRCSSCSDCQRCCNSLCFSQVHYPHSFIQHDELPEWLFGLEPTRRL